MILDERGSALIALAPQYQLFGGSIDLVLATIAYTEFR